MSTEPDGHGLTENELEAARFGAMFREALVRRGYDPDAELPCLLCNTVTVRKVAFLPGPRDAIIAGMTTELLAEQDCPWNAVALCDRCCQLPAAYEKIRTKLSRR